MPSRPLRAGAVTTAMGVALLIAACDDGPAEVPAGVCGNLVVEPGEQCDGEAQCGAVGATACRFTCVQDTQACPGALACSVDGVCVASAERFVPYASAPRYELPADRIVVGDLDDDGRDDLIGVGESVRVRFGADDEPLRASFEKLIRPPTGAAAFGQLDDRPGLDVVFPTADGVFVLVARGRSLEAVPYASAATLPAETAPACVGPASWAACRSIDLDGDGLLDRAGYVADGDNLRIELARAGDVSVSVTFDTTDVITDLTAGDLDGDGFGDLAFATRSVDGVAAEAVQVLYGAPQATAFRAVPVVTAESVRGVAAVDLDAPPDGLVDLAIDRVLGGVAGVAIHRGDAARDLSAPFRLDGGRATLDVPYAVVAGEFVGGTGSGIDVMAYARNPDDATRAYFWWLRGLGAAQLAFGAVDPVDATSLDFLDGEWRVADLVTDSATGNGPDEVVGLSPVASGCAGPALTAAVPSARFTATDLLRSACLGVEGTGWAPALIGLLDGVASDRAVVLAQRARSWWIGEADRLDEATEGGQLAGTATTLDGDCRDPQLWAQTPDHATALSWICDGGSDATIRALAVPRAGAVTTTTVATVPRGVTHVSGDWNGDGLTDLVVREGRDVVVMLQCSTDLVGIVPGC